jgi:hypothetical protein
MENNSTATNRLNMDRIMDASFGEVSNSLTVTFKKTVLTKQYETEVVEATSTIELDHPLIGIERMFITGVIQAQLEYGAYINLVSKGLVTKTELNNRKIALEEDLYSIKYKADQILGPGVIDKYLDYNNLDK